MVFVVVGVVADVVVVADAVVVVAVVVVAFFNRTMSSAADLGTHFNLSC